MRPAAKALALTIALGALALPSVATRTGEIGQQSLVPHPAPPELATLLQRGNPPLVCHLAHSAMRDRQSSELAQTLDETLDDTVDGVRDPAPPETGLRPLTIQVAAPAQAEVLAQGAEPSQADAEEDDAVTPADVMLMVAALALASLSVLVVRG